MLMKGEAARSRGGPPGSVLLWGLFPSSPPHRLGSRAHPSAAASAPGRGAEKVEAGRRVQEGGQGEAKLKMKAEEGAAEQCLESCLHNELHQPGLLFLQILLLLLCLSACTPIAFLLSSLLTSLAPQYSPQASSPPPTSLTPALRPRPFVPLIWTSPPPPGFSSVSLQLPPISPCPSSLCHSLFSFRLQVSHLYLPAFIFPFHCPAPFLLTDPLPPPPAFTPSPPFSPCQLHCLGLGSTV